MLLELELQEVLNIGPLQEQYLLLTAKSSLQIPTLLTGNVCTCECMFFLSPLPSSVQKSH